MEESVLQRIRWFLKNKDVSIALFSKKANFVQTTINRQLRGDSQLSGEVIEALLRFFPDLSSEWLLRGEGEMFKEYRFVDKAEKDSNNSKDGSIPYYGTLPVSAGQLDLASLASKEDPTGWIKLPGLSDAFGAFPVVGCSMEPYIHPGDFVAISTINSWERLDPDKVYLIITHEDRMIKHLYNDPDDSEALWCVSPNYPKFKLLRSEIKAIYRIAFHGRIL